MAQTSGGLALSILSAWGDLPGSMRTRLAARPRDAELLVWALIAALIGFVAGLPETLRQAQGMESDDAATGVVATRLFAAIFLTPLFLLVTGSLSHIIARLFGGTGTGWSGRVALIWAVLVSVPLVLLNGAATAFLPPALVSALSILTLIGFLWIWANCLTVAENFSNRLKVFTVMAVPPLLIAGILPFLGP